MSLYKEMRKDSSPRSEHLVSCIPSSWGYFEIVTLLHVTICLPGKARYNEPRGHGAEGACTKPIRLAGMSHLKAATGT